MLSDGIRQNRYDVENRLIRTAAPGGDVFYLSYDPLGRLLETTFDGAVTRFLYDGDRLVAEYDGADAVTARYVHGPGPDEALVWYDGAGLSGRRWLHADHQNSTVAVSTAAAAIVGAPYAYDPYGNPDAGHGFGGVRFRYTGQISLTHAPYWHYKARAYQPQIGRFLQTDPVGYEEGLNLYAYVGNDPMNGIDPTGMLFTDVYIGGAGDQIFGEAVINYANANGNAPGRTVGYFTWRQGAEALAFIRANAGNGEPINIIGHSYGADTAAVVANSYEGQIDTLVGVDPVSQPGWDVMGRNGSPDNVGTVVSVNASGPRMSISEAIEGVGKAIGGGIPGAFRQPGVSIDTIADHAEFQSIYHAPGSDGQSASDIVNNTYRRAPR